ncbi:MAG: helix-turn-helix domain-containing protein [Rhodococcus sp. (in: high G+C Gram-positive bacteria)]
MLEAMMQRASDTDAGLAVAVSIRSLASSLGLSKDTIARSVRRLRDAGLVSSIQRRDTSGVFAAGSYRLAVPRRCLSLVSSSVPVAGAPAESLVRPARRSSGQLALSLSRSEVPSRVRLSLRSVFNFHTGACVPTRSRRRVRRSTGPCCVYAGR